MNTNKRRELADSKYNERRTEYELVLRRLQTILPIQLLGELTEEQFEQHKGIIVDPWLIRRAKHAVTENQRTIKAKNALGKNDLKGFGQLLNASHTSLKEDYEVTISSYSTKTTRSSRRVYDRRWFWWLCYSLSEGKGIRVFY